jgi:hypothetical protein
LIDDLLFSSSFTATGGAPFLENRKLTLVKENKLFKMEFTLGFEERVLINDIFYIPIGEYTIISDTSKVYILPQKSTSLSNVSETVGELDFKVLGTITQIATTPISNFDGKIHRVIIPVDDKQFSFEDYEHFIFTADIEIRNRQLIRVSIKDLKFHLFTFKINDKIYWAIDSLQILDFRKFQGIAYSVFNTYGFIEGDLHLNEAYYFCCGNTTFESDVDLFYSSIRNSLLTGYGMITTNPYSILVPFYKTRGLPLNQDEIKPWYSLLLPFKEKVFSNIVQLFYEYDSLNRTALIILEANTQPLELKAASYCVAFEAVCNTIKKHFGIDSANVIDRVVWDQDVKPAFIKQLGELTANKKINDQQSDILSKKLNNWNQPTNADSLTAPFKKYGYILNVDEFKCVDNRNKFLHGSLPVDERNDDEAFRELYHISMTLHKLLYVLIFKMTGFEGYIINYPKIHENITSRSAEEQAFIKI